MSTLAGLHLDKPLARGRSSLPVDARRLLQRQRLRRAIVSCCGDRGFAATSVADIVSAARVSRATFYEFYADREACLLDAAGAAWGLMRQRIAAATAKAGDDPWAVLSALVSSYLGVLAAEPEFARLFELDLMMSGPLGLEARFASHREMAAALGRWHQGSRAVYHWPELPEAGFMAIVGAVDALVVQQVSAGRSAALGDLQPTILDLVHRLMTGSSPQS